MTRACIELHYLPSITYFARICRFGEVALEAHEHYIKQTFRNRCYINTTHGPNRLVIPLTGKPGKVPVTDIRIDYRQKWTNNHWRSIVSAYAKAPWFEHYEADLRKTLYSGNEFLWELNYNLLTMCLGWLGLRINLVQTLAYDKILPATTADLRNQVLPVKGTETSNGKPIPYKQVFGQTFVDNLSILDLVFCTGPEAFSFLNRMTEQISGDFRLMKYGL